jgi:hypothetical protein
MLLSAAPVAMASVAPHMRAQTRAAASAPMARSVSAQSSSFAGVAIKATARPSRAAARGQSLVTRALAIPGEILVRFELWC